MNAALKIFVIVLCSLLAHEVNSLTCGVTHSKNSLFVDDPRATTFSNRIWCTLAKAGTINDQDSDVVFDTATQTFGLPLHTDVVDVTVGIQWQIPAYRMQQNPIGQQSEIKITDRSGNVVVRVVLPNVTPTSPVWWTVSEASRRVFLFYLDAGVTKTAMSIAYNSNVTWTSPVDGVDMFSTRSLAGSYNDDSQLFQFLGDTSKTCNSFYWYRFTNSTVNVLPGGDFYGTPSYFDNRMKQLVTIAQTPTATFTIYNYLNGATVSTYTVPTATLQKIQSKVGTNMSGWIAAVVILTLLSFFLIIGVIVAVNKIRRLSIRQGNSGHSLVGQ